MSVVRAVWVQSRPENSKHQHDIVLILVSAVQDALRTATAQARTGELDLEWGVHTAGGRVKYWEGQAPARRSAARSNA